LLLRSAEGKPFFAQISHAGSRDRAQVARPACKGHQIHPKQGGSPALRGAPAAARGVRGG